MLRQHNLIPKQAYLLFPVPEAILRQGKNNKNQVIKQKSKRLIFGNGKFPEYTKFQLQKIQQFKQYIVKKQNNMNKINQSKSKNGTTQYQQDHKIQQQLLKYDNVKLLRFIYANKFKFDQAYINYEQYKKWQFKFMPINNINAQYKTKMDNLLKTGIIYVSPLRDQYFKPIIIVHVGRLLKIKPQNQLFLDTFGYFLQSIIQSMLIQGQLQTWNVIVDVDETGVFSFANTLFQLIKFLSRIFINRMFRCFVVNHPFIIKFFWTAVSKMMDQEQNDKTKILNYAEILKYIPKECLEKRYGGDIDEIKWFWPLNSEERVKIQDENYHKIKQHWVSNNKLITEEQYYQRYLNGLIGNKQCTQIIQSYKKRDYEQLQRQFNQEQQNSNISSYQQITSQQLKQLNSNIPKQRLPLILKIQQQNNIETAQFLHDQTLLDSQDHKTKQVQIHNKCDNNTKMSKKKYIQVSSLIFKQEKLDFKQIQLII